MKMKLALLAATSLMATGSAFATVSLNFNVFFGGVSQNFANTGGVVTNDLFYGVLVDSNNNGFLETYSAITLTSEGVYSLTTTGSAATDDVLILSSSRTGSTAGFLEGDFSTGGAGGIFDVNGINLAGTVGAGDKFYVVWFDGNKAGTLGDASFVLPADGSNSDFDAPFAGADPIRSAGLNYTGSGAQGAGNGITFVPEPSAALLGAVGALGLLRRRRN